MKRIFLILIIMLLAAGCGNNLSPLSPELKQNIDAQNSKIEEIKNNQNGVNLELGKIRSNQTVTAEKLDNIQQGLVNLKGSSNSGVQILSGDGTMIALFSICIVAMILIYHFRTKAQQHEKTANILAQQISNYGDSNLENQIYMAALNSSVEENIFNLIKNKKLK